MQQAMETEYHMTALKFFYRRDIQQLNQGRFRRNDPLVKPIRGKNEGTTFLPLNQVQVGQFN